MIIFQNDIRKTVLIINLLPLSYKYTLFACSVKMELGLFNVILCVFFSVEGDGETLKDKRVFLVGCAH